MKSELEAIQWVIHHGKANGRFIYRHQDAGIEWSVGEASVAEENTRAGHFWELKDDKARIWERCIDCKTRTKEWIVRPWANITCVLAGLKHLQDTKNRL